MSDIRDAATVVLMRRPASGPPAVLMGLRGAGAAFMPSKYVFPGGAVDPSDTGPADEPLLRRELRPGPDADRLPGALLACARRELLEETGLALRPDAPLHFVFRAITPPGRPRRFDARFFLADASHVVGDPDDFSAACDELSALSWVPLREAATLDLPFITEVVLAEIGALADATLPPQAVPFFDNRAEPRFVRLAR